MFVGKLFGQNPYTELNENPVNILAAGIRSLTEGRGLHCDLFLLLFKERLKRNYLHASSDSSVQVAQHPKSVCLRRRGLYYSYFCSEDLIFS
jgi:hypothetical protein